MLNGKLTDCIYIGLCKSFNYSECFYNRSQHARTHSHTNKKVASLHSASLLIRNSYTDTHTPNEQLSGEIWGSESCLKDISIHRQLEPGIRPPTFWLVDNLLHLLGFSRPEAVLSFLTVYSCDKTFKYCCPVAPVSVSLWKMNGR